MSERDRPLVLSLFEMASPVHLSHGLWTHPLDQRHRVADIGFWRELGSLLEYGTFDELFLADVLGAYDVFDDGLGTAVREGFQIPALDPLIVLGALADATDHLGLVATFSTTYEPPFTFARRLATLDHLSKGRIGWNIVTSYLTNAARNFGLADQIEHDARYEIADEFLDVVYRLLLESWDDDAITADRDRRVYAEPDAVRYIDHVGSRFRVAGPSLTAPSAQRVPVLFQAGSSLRGFRSRRSTRRSCSSADRPSTTSVRTSTRSVCRRRSSAVIPTPSPSSPARTSSSRRPSRRRARRRRTTPDIARPGGSHTACPHSRPDPLRPDRARRRHHPARRSRVPAADPGVASWADGRRPRREGAELAEGDRRRLVDRRRPGAGRHSARGDRRLRPPRRFQPEPGCELRVGARLHRTRRAGAAATRSRPIELSRRGDAAGASVARPVRSPPAPDPPRVAGVVTRAVSTPGTLSAGTRRPAGPGRTGRSS
ncbi:NtaA/DmoA family FMN-dependent monooxygenase [Microbacterium sp. Se63.02b]|nr:NtaA/DmoA family FMN-dependent monooxygenase [Microbacterium sp. Se63.02b]